jgi:hypothetical protein
MLADEDRLAGLSEDLFDRFDYARTDEELRNILSSLGG